MTPSDASSDKIAGLLLVMFDAPDTPDVTDWLFGEHARQVVASVPGVSRSRTFRIANPARPGQPRWITILDTEDLEATWRHRWLAGPSTGQREATNRGVGNREEFFARLVNDVRK
jgi:hypothetical protein